jgi:hypothetical protein
MNEFVELTPHQIREITLCAQSPEYFIETYCWLQQKAAAGGSSQSTIPFIMGKVKGEPHFFQREILRWLSGKENVVAYKSRRVGCSWIAAAYVAWLINFTEGSSVLFISQNGLKAKQILAKVKFILNNLALHDNINIKQATRCAWLRGEVYSDNVEKLSICYRNDDGSISALSEVLSLNNTDNTGRGDDATFVVFDELAFYEHPEETWSSAKKATALGGHWMAISTAGPIGDVFYRLVAKGELDKRGELGEELNYRYTGFIHYRDAGITDDQVNRASEGDTSERREQEWEGQFISPGTVVFNPTHLAACYKPPKDYPEIEQLLSNYRGKVLSKENKGIYIYYNGADTSVGKRHKKATEKDYHCFTALTGDGIQAYTYTSKEELSSWAGMVVNDGAGRRVEVQGKLSMIHAEWPGLLYAEEDGPGLTAINNHELPHDTFSEIVPVAMKHLMKRGIIEQLILAVENHQLVITDYFTYLCMSVYQQHSPGIYGAPTGYYDDPVMALALAWAGLRARGILSTSSWGNTIDQTKRANVYDVEPQMFISGKMFELRTPGETQRMSDQLLPPVGQEYLGDYSSLKWLAQVDEENFAKVGGIHVEMH